MDSVFLYPKHRVRGGRARCLERGSWHLEISEYIPGVEPCLCLRRAEADGSHKAAGDIVVGAHAAAVVGCHQRLSRRETAIRIRAHNLACMTPTMNSMTRMGP